MAKEPSSPTTKISRSNARRARKVRAAAAAQEGRGIAFIPNEKQAPPPPFSTQKMFIFDRPQPVGRVQLELPDSALRDVLAQRQLAVTHVYRTLDAMQGDLQKFFPKLSDPLPAIADGILLNPDGTPAAGVAVEALEPNYGDDANAKNALAKVGWTFPSAVTDARGAFRLNLPTVQIPGRGLQLRVRGANAQLELDPINRVRLLEGRLGLIPINQQLAPLPQESVVAQLKEIQADILATTKDDVVNRPDQFATPPQQMTIGDGDCARLFRSNNGVIDSFRYSTLIRLIEPQMNIWQPLFRIGLENQRFLPFALPEANDALWRVVDAQNAVAKLQALGHLTLVNRAPISQPIDVTGFHNQIEVSPVALPKASTLGLGYTVDLQQVWIPAGMSLGDLVYSLPLAPGEQQRIAIEESTKTLTDRTIETFSVDELQTFRETQDSSAIAVFQSAFDEAARGGSHMESSSKTGSVAAEASTGIIGAIFGGGGVSGGYSSSSSSGSTSSWQNTSRDFTSNAAQDMHSALNRVAAASRRGSQTSIRVASETEHTQVTTRIVTNHNKNHALTMQWWQVLRHFTVTSEVDDVQMVCFVPLELIQFLPEGQPFSLPGMPGEAGVPLNLFGLTPRQFLLNRYAMVLRYWDVITPFFRRNPEYAYGMRALRDFAANPEAVPERSKLQQDVLQFQVTGTFLPFEELFVTVVTKSGGALAPVKLKLAKLPNPVFDITPERFTSGNDLLGALKTARLKTEDPATLATLEAFIPLPNWIARSDIARFDLSRRFGSFTYRLKLPDGALGDVLNFLDIIQKQTVSFSASVLEQQLGGPIITKALAKVDTTDFLPPNVFAAGDQMPGTLPMPALRVAPILSFADLLRIEAVYHHIVRNTVFYSKAVWAALSDEERAILLERFTIGVPAGGIQTADQEVPLLNCVANRVLGFFGNALIMPFGIPPDVAKRMGVTSRDIQDALLRFHRQAFQPPRSSITLPAHGTLGEAVLGCCDSAEKIDLTRFWNWQDSPSDQADAIPTNVFAPPQPIPAATAPGGGGSGVGGGAGSSGSIISINSPPATTPSSALLEALIKQSPDLAKELNLTGLDTLQKQIATDTQSAASGRKEALDSVTNIQLQAMKSAEGMVKSVADAAGKVGAAALGVPPAGGG
ncbi:MAG: hypothetical protein ACXWFY_04100, partial [Chthoniobacterales bacterium]